MTPVEHYQQDLLLGGILHDPAQEQAVHLLQNVYDALLQKQRKHKKIITSLLGKFFSKTQKPIKGLYLWGGVGIGKTFLMDIFYHALPIQKKERRHFHHFMHAMQNELRSLQGQVNPLEIIAERISDRCQVLCFDEFLVWDLADAMILARLFAALFKRGVSLVATSNVHPDDLYKNGLQRPLFIPAIELIKKNTTVFEVGTQTDYRLRTLEDAGVYFYPINEDTHKSMREYFAAFARGKGSTRQVIEVERRAIQSIAVAPKVAWFDFNELCNIPRSQIDYLELTKHYHTLLLSNVPIIEKNNHTAARYFINLIDILYDAQVKLVISAAVPIEDIYPEGTLSFEFKRTVSRLQEMQSEDYLALPHRTT